MIKKIVNEIIDDANKIISKYNIRINYKLDMMDGFEADVDFH